MKIIAIEAISKVTIFLCLYIHEIVNIPLRAYTNNIINLFMLVSKSFENSTLKKIVTKKQLRV